MTRPPPCSAQVVIALLMAAVLSVAPFPDAPKNRILVITANKKFINEVVCSLFYRFKDTIIISEMMKMGVVMAYLWDNISKR